MGKHHTVGYVTLNKASHTHTQLPVATTDICHCPRYLKSLTSPYIITKIECNNERLNCKYICKN